MKVLALKKKGQSGIQVRVGLTFLRTCIPFYTGPDDAVVRSSIRWLFYNIQLV